MGKNAICGILFFLQYHRWILGKSVGGQWGLSFFFWNDQDGSGMRTSVGQSSSVSWRCSQTEMNWIWVEEGQRLYQGEDAMIGSDIRKGREVMILLLTDINASYRIHLWLLCPPDNDCQQNWTRLSFTILQPCVHTFLPRLTLDIWFPLRFDHYCQASQRH